MPLPTPPSRGVYHAPYTYRGQRVLLAIDQRGDVVDWRTAPLDPRAIRHAKRELRRALDAVDPAVA